MIVVICCFLWLSGAGFGSWVVTGHPAGLVTCALALFAAGCLTWLRRVES